MKPFKITTELQNALETLCLLPSSLPLKRKIINYSYFHEVRDFQKRKQEWKRSIIIWK